MPYTVSITSQGQVSIPAKIRRKLGLEQKGKALVSEENGKMIIEPVSDLLDLSGSLKTRKKPLANQELHQKFAEYLSKEVVGKASK